jgi:hypothetical protein
MRGPQGRALISKEGEEGRSPHSFGVQPFPEFTHAVEEMHAHEVDELLHAWRCPYNLP